MHREAVYGPYAHRRGWRVEIHITGRGRREKTRRTFATESDALEFKRAVEREIARAQHADALRAKAGELHRLARDYAREADRRDGQALTVRAAMERYALHMAHDKGNKPRTIATTLHRLRGLLGDCDVPLHGITEDDAVELYRARRGQVAVDTHRNELGQVKTFMAWCRDQGWIFGNPFTAVKGVGKRRRGKEQLRIDETRRVVAVALAQARMPPSGRRRDAQHRESSLAVLAALYLGMRASEVVNIRRRDVDARGRLLWIPDSKTEHGRRTLEVADVLRPLLWQRAQACGDAPDARLFAHARSWVLYNVKRLCRAAEVPEVTAHGARGIHATIATQMGTTSHIVALALGHGSAAVTRRHYIRPGTAEQATQARLEQLLSVPTANYEQLMAFDSAHQGDEHAPHEDGSIPERHQRVQYGISII